MKKRYIFYFLLLIIIPLKDSASANWCKAIYPYSKEALDGNFQKQLSLCKNSDNLFLSIHSNYDNALHLLHTSIASFWDLTKQVIKSEIKKTGSSFYSFVCVFRRHKLREE